MKITQKMVAEVKRMNKVEWHDRAWHDFMRKKETVIINHVINWHSSSGDPYTITNREVVEGVKEAISENFFED